MPAVSTFPRAAWLRSLRTTLATVTDADLGYGDPRGDEALRAALADYLGRVRGVAADPEHIIITNGYTQGLGLVCHALARAGAKRIALDDPSNPDDGLVAARAGLQAVPIGVDKAGTRVDQLKQSDADAVVVTPSHQHPTGVVLTGERRTALLAWLRDRSAIAIEDELLHDDEETIRKRARHRRVEFETMSDFRPNALGWPPALGLGYAQMSEPAVVPAFMSSPKRSK